jgi:hypothetical protein
VKLNENEPLLEEENEGSDYSSSDDASDNGDSPVRVKPLKRQKKMETDAF